MVALLIAAFVESYFELKKMQPFTRITESIKYSKISGFKLCNENRFARVQINYVALGGDGINKYFFLTWPYPPFRPFVIGGGALQKVC